MARTYAAAGEQVARDPEHAHYFGNGRNLGSAERWVSVAAGASLFLLGLRYKAHRVPLMAAGGGLASRGIAGWCPVYAGLGTASNRSETKAALGGSGGIRVEESVTINAPVAHLYSFWRNLENLPRFMRHLESVRSRSDKQSHWVARGPAGVTVEWDALVINEVDNELIGWRTLEGADVVSAGSVAFEPVGDGTRVTVTLQYDPPAGKMGAMVARMFGEDPAGQIRSDLQRLKKYFESGQLWLPSSERSLNQA
jgi:uncharacterized membrane protein